jgi:plastocyanin
LIVAQGQPAPSAGGGGKGKWVALGVVVVVILAGLAYFFLYGIPIGGASSSITPVNVVMPNGVASNTNLNFQPASITVVIGVNNTVVWTNQDTVSHTVVSKSGAPVTFGSATTLIMPGQSFPFTFTTPGTYNYFCNIHPTNMQATIIVKA